MLTVKSRDGDKEKSLLYFDAFYLINFLEISVPIKKASPRAAIVNKSDIFTCLDI